MNSRGHSSQHAAAGVSRRDFLAAGFALTSISPLHARAVLAQADPGARFLSARRHDGRHEVVLLDAAARDLAVLALPDRGHSFAIDAGGQRAVVFGRQPGFYATAFSLADCRPLGTLPLPADRHFFGHGVFSADGTRLFATENDFANGRGVLGVYDARPGAGWQRVGEFDTGGIGPHEVVLMPGHILCIANGGILTHPDYGKTPLNLATMRPNLAYLDARDGRLLETVSLPPALFQLSIRHLVVDGSGAVWFACQHEGPGTPLPALLGRHRRGYPAEQFAGPPAVLRSLRNYLGSIAFDHERGVIATSSPVGGTVAFWDAADGTSLGTIARADACGIAMSGTGQFLISDGFGAMIAAGPGGKERQLMGTSAQLAWDNHLRRA